MAYESPQVKVELVEVEQGFAVSGINSSADQYTPVNIGGDNI